MFRVPWQDDRGEIQINRGFRIEMNSAIGPYKGGLRFHPSVNLGILKFLAFEQVFKNSLTTLPMGGGKGGSDFDPQGQERQRSDALLPELHDRAVPPHRPEHRRAGGRHRRRRPRDRLPVRPVQAAAQRVHRRADRQGAELGRLADPSRGDRLRRVYFAAEMLATRNETLEGKICLVSGSGNVAQYTIEKLLDLGAKPVTLSDSNGYIYDEAGIDREKLAFVMELKNVRRGRIKEYADQLQGARSTPPLDPTLDHNPLWNHRRSARSRARRRTRSTRSDAANLLAQRRRTWSPKGANMPSDARRRARSSSTPGSSTRPARRPTPAAWRRRAWRWRRTARADAGRARKWTTGCTRS